MEVTNEEIDCPVCGTLNNAYEDAVCKNCGAELNGR